MSKSKTERVPLDQFTGAVYRCNNCGACFNTYDFVCPVCAVESRTREMVQIGVAASSIPMTDGRKAKRKAKSDDKTPSPCAAS